MIVHATMLCDCGDPACPGADGDVCNYEVTRSTRAWVLPYPQVRVELPCVFCGERIQSGQLFDPGGPRHLGCR